MRAQFFFGLVLMLSLCSCAKEAEPDKPAPVKKYDLSTNEVYVLNFLLDDDARAFVDGADNAMYASRLAKVRAQDIAKKYAENEVAADQEYKGKTTLIDGTVISINSGINDKPFLVLKGVNVFMGPHAEFQSPDIEKISAIKKGEEIRLICAVSGEVIGTPMLRDCIFPEKYVETAAPEIQAELAQFLESGSVSSDSAIPMFVAGAITYARILPPDSPCFSDKAKCESAIGSILSGENGKDEFKKTVELMRSKGLAVSIPDAK